MNIIFLQRFLFGRIAIALGSSLLMVSAAWQAQANDRTTKTQATLKAELRAGNWPKASQQLLIKPEVEAFVTDLMSKMTLDEKVAQMMQAEINAVTPQELRTVALGSILAGGDSAPNKNDINAPASAWLALADDYVRASLEYKSASHPAIPIIFGVDAVHGHGHLGGATIFPHNVGLGAARDAELIERIGRISAKEIAATGIEWTFAPTLAVVRDARWGRTYESYSEDPRVVASYAGRMVKGIQGDVSSQDFAKNGYVIASAKHYLGDGGTEQGRDQFDNLTSVSEFIRVHAAGYAPAINAGALTVMASYNGWHGIKMHENEVLLTDVLKGRMGFNGFVIGDWNAHEEIPGCTRMDCPAAINAGVDMIMVPYNWREFLATTVAHVKAGKISQARIDDAVRRILRVKALAGMFERSTPAQRPETKSLNLIGSAEHRAVAREAVRKSLVLLKNNHQLLPLNPKKHVLIAGDAADNIAKQSGGWSIDWQGKNNTNASFPGATSIFAGIQSAIKNAGGTVTLSIDGTHQNKPDVAIVIFGESPYAEFQGDRETLEFGSVNSTELKIMRDLKAAGVPVVAVFISGRPMWTNRQLNAADAFVAAWLPGSEGAGVADVLFRKADDSINHDFAGSLSFSWPSTVMPVTFKNGDEPVGALFARGYGLNYSSSSTVAQLSETPNAKTDRHDWNVLFADAHVVAPWSVVVKDDLADVRLTSLTQASPAQAVSVTRDQNLNIKWTGKGRGELRIAGSGDNLSALANTKAIQIQFSVVEKPAAPIYLGLRCALTFQETQAIKNGTAPKLADNGSNCKASKPAFYDITAQVSATNKATIQIPLSCFVKHGADISNVAAPLSLITTGKAQLKITDARLAEVSKTSSTCPSDFADTAVTAP
jgi:beta-glucosidase